MLVKNTIATILALITAVSILLIPVLEAVKGEYLLAAEFFLINVLLLALITQGEKTKEQAKQTASKIEQLIKYTAKEESLNTYTDYVAQAFNKLVDIKKQQH